MSDDQKLVDTLKSAAATGGAVPPEVEQARKAPFEDDKNEIVCCKYYVGFGQWRYKKMTKNTCEKPPISGDVVDDSECD